MRVWYVRKKSAYACVIRSTTCNAELQCGTKWFSNWKASLLCRASRGFPNRKLLTFEINNFSAASSLQFTSHSGVQHENITEAVPESAEEAAEEADLSTLVDISILNHARRHTPSQISGENPVLIHQHKVTKYMA